MTKEKLIEKIMRECEQVDEPVTKEEAAEMAEMEIKANSHRRYEKSNNKRKSAKRERKIDEEKKHLLMCVKTLLEGLNSQITAIKTETEISFIYNDNEYSFKLIKHRKKGE